MNNKGKVSKWKWDKFPKRNGNFFAVQMRKFSLNNGKCLPVRMKNFPQYKSLQTIAACLCVLDKLQGKAVTHFCEVEWWRTLMVECVTVFLLFNPTSDFTIIERKCLSYLND